MTFLFFSTVVRRKTIYEYHRVSLKGADIGNETAIYFRALSTCNRKTDCETCLGDEDSEKLGVSSEARLTRCVKIVTTPINSLQCKWCPSLDKCSDGIDRNRQHWLKQCDSERYHVEKEDRCDIPLPASPTSGGSGDKPWDDWNNNHNHHYPESDKKDDDDFGAGGGGDDKSTNAELNDEEQKGDGREREC